MTNIFSFTGRSTRTEFWVSQLIYAIFYILLLVGIDGYNDILSIIGGLGMIIAFIPVIAIQVKRFHDLNRTGALVFINFVPYVGGLITTIWLGFYGPENIDDKSNLYGDDPRLK